MKNIPKITTLYDLTTDSKVVATVQNYSKVNQEGLVAQVNSWLAQGPANHRDGSVSEGTVPFLLGPGSWKYDALGWFLTTKTAKRIMKPIPATVFANMASAHKLARLNGYQETYYMKTLREKHAKD